MESRKRKIKAVEASKAKKKATRRSKVTEHAEEDLVCYNESESETEESNNTPPDSEDDSEPEVELTDAQNGRSMKEGGGGQPTKGKGLYKPPTHSELQTLKETQDLFSSNLMRLQISELMSEIKPKSASKKKVDSFLHKLKETLTSLPSSKQINLCDGLSLLSKKVSFPLNLDVSNSKGKFQFVAPSVVKVIGGYLLGTLCKPHPSVDLSVHIPVECLQVKDILNYRYFQKRALYLSIMAGHLYKRRKSLGIKSVQFSSTGNPLLPTLMLTLPGSKVTIVLHTTISDDKYFKLSKLVPGHNNVRRYYLSQLSHQSYESQNPSDESQEDLPTPHYNASLLSELGSKEKHLVTLYSALHDCPGVIDAVLLCKVWARQRGLDKGVGGLRGFHFSMLAAWLCTQSRLSAHMSSYQAFRIILQSFVASDWSSSGVAMTQVPLDAYYKAFDVVFVDECGLNIFADLSKDRYRWIQHEASLSLGNLDNQSANGFQALLITSLPPELKFDIILHVPGHLVSAAAVLRDEGEREAILLDTALSPLPPLVSRMLSILQQGLGKRAKLITTLPQASKQWSLSDSAPPPTEDIAIALLLDTEHAFSAIEVGPPSDSSEAQDFRDFWGEKAGLRRFKDGSIREAMVWAEKMGVASSRTIPALIIRHLLERHAGVPGKSVRCVSNSLDSLISLPSYSSHNTGEVSTGEEVGGGLVGVVTELGRDLRGLKDLPLSVSSVQGCGPAFRHTQVFPYHPWNGRLGSKYTTPPDKASQSDCYYPSCDVATPPFVPAYKVVCQLESSGKWPDDVDAIAKIKTSFYIYISKALKEKGILSSPTAEYLDILKSGYVFRVRIHYHRELLLLKDAATKATGSEEQGLKHRLREIERELVSLPLLTSRLNGVHQLYPAYAPGARLCKRWVAAHLLSAHISDETVELLVASLFLNPAPYTHPNMPLLVFLRFLLLLGTFDWTTEPLVVNFNNELSDSDLAKIMSQFASSRSSLPPLVIATPTDHTHWSTPSPPVFARLQLLANESLSVLLDQGTSDFKQVFRPPLDDYHVIIHLHKRHVPRREQAVDPTATDLDSSQPVVRYKHKYTHLPVVDFDPVEKFVHTLEESYSDYALFFYDQYGGSYIAIAWKPSAFIPQPFKVMQTLCHKKEGKGMVPDTVAIVADFELLGEGLVKKIDIVSYTP